MTDLRGGLHAIKTVWWTGITRLCDFDEGMPLARRDLQIADSCDVGGGLARRHWLRGLDLEAPPPQIRRE